MTGNKRSELYYTPWVSGHALYDDDDRRRHHHYCYCSLNYEEITHCTFYDQLHPHHDKVNTLFIFINIFSVNMTNKKKNTLYYHHHDKDKTVRRGKGSLSASVCTGSFEGLVTIAVMNLFLTSSLDEF